MGYTKEKGITFGGIPLTSKALTYDASTEFLNQLQTMGLKKDNGENRNIRELADNYADQWGKVDDSVVSYVESVQEGNNKLKEGQTLLQGYKQQYTILGKFTTGLKDGIKSVVGGLGAALVSGFTTLAASFVISNVIKGVNSLRKSVGLLTKKEKAENLKKAISDGEAAQKSIDSAFESLSSHTKTIDEIKERFSELSKGVDEKTGKNLSLTNEEYEEFLDYNRQIIDMFPDVSRVYTENGNAIVQLGNYADTTSDALNKLLEQERLVANQELIDSLPTIFEGIKGQSDTLKNEINDYKSQIADLEKAISLVPDVEEIIQSIKPGEQLLITSSEYSKYRGIIDDLLKDAGINRGNWNKTQSGDFSLDLSVSKKDLESFKSQFERYSTDILITYNNELDKLQNGLSVKNTQFENNWTGLNTSVLAYLDTDSNYKMLSDEMRNYIQKSIDNTDWGKLNFDSWEELVDYLNTDLIALFQGENGQNLIDAIDLMSGYEEQYKAGEITYDEYVKYIGNFRSALYRYITDEKVRLSFWDFFDFTDDEADVNKIKEFVSDLPDDWALSEEDMSVAVQVIADSESEHMTWEELQKAIEEYKQLANDNPVKIRTSVDTVNDLADAKAAFSSLESLYDQVVNMNPADGQATGFADPALLNSVESAFGGIAEEDAKVAAALENFEDTLVKFPNDAEKAQDAIDDLVTAYIDQTDVIKDLTEENKDYAIAQLEAQGITNAQEVILSRLGDSAKKTADNIKTLSKSLEDNYDIIKKGSKNNENYDGSLNSIKEATANLFSYEDNGEVITPTLSDEFILQNLEDIRLAALGDIDALNRLRVEAAKEIAANVSIKGNYGEVMAIQGEINELIDGFDINDITVDTDLNDLPMIQGLNNLVEAGKITRDSMNSILAGIGVVPEQTGYVDMPISTFGSIGNAVSAMGLKGIAATEAAKGLSRLDSNATIRVPSFGYKLASGSKAHYGGGAKSSSSGGGGGGGGGSSSSSEPNKPKEESEEMFDWVEVAIQRLEEQQQRLDKTVGNTYTLWTKRNEALSKEINTVTQEIKAQQLAQQEYQKYLNSIKVNNGKGLNDDDYGENDELVKQADQALLDEANRLWATGEYQKKIMEGLLSGDDIEKIANHFLVDTINEFTEMYNKAVAAGDAVQDLTIKLGELAETKFDNIQSEYDELIAYVTAYADIIDERINRTEEHGYFVSKDYYRQLIEYENQQLAKLNSEYGDLIKARDEAVAAGYITEGSSAWNNMNQEILAVEKSIEESTTALVEFNNNIRDLDWEIFDWLEERISRITDEAEFLVDLMSNDKLYEDDGRLTNLGQATNGLYAIQYETLMRQAQDYAEERLKLEREIAKDPANKDLIERYEELVDAQQDAIKGAEDMKNAVKDLVEEAINLHLSKLDELIDKYETALDKEKDLYEYSKNIDKQIKNINNLERMLNAYSGDDSEEARKIRQQTANSLEEARQQLEETEWDRMISETKELLTDMRDDYEEVLMARLDDVDALMHDMIENANENTGVIKDTIATETDKVGYILTDPLNKILNDTSTNTLVSNFMSKFESAATSVQSVLETIKQYVYSMTDTGKAEVEAERQAKIKAAQQAETQRQAEAQRQTQAQAAAQAEAQRKAEAAKQAQAQQSTASSSPQGDGVPNVGDKVTFASGRYYEDSYGNGRSGSKYQGQEVYITKINSKGSKPYHISTGSTLGSGNLGWVTLDQLRGYMMGSRRIPYNQLAWTQENGSEMIYRSSDGAMLTPLGTGDMVFTKEMSQRLYDLAGSDIPTIKSNTSKPNVQSTVGNNVTNQNAISFTLPNVKNYDEFIREMKRDNRFQGFIQEITFGQANGNNSLNKNKF